jgi:hypothetical protein
MKQIPTYFLNTPRSRNKWKENCYHATQFLHLCC